MSKSPSRTLNTPDFTGAFISVFEPKKQKQKDKDGNDKYAYQVTALFDEGETLDAIKAAATEIMTELFGDKKNWPAARSERVPNGWKKPWRDQAEKAADNPDLGPSDQTYDGYYSGRLFMNLNSQNPPDVVDHKVQKIMKQSDIYSGARYTANINVFWYDNESKGIGVSLNCLMKVGEGKPLGAGQVSAASVFSPRQLDKSQASTAAFDDDDEDPMA